MRFFFFKSAGRNSLLAEALLLVFADGRKETLFSRQRTAGKEPLLAGKTQGILESLTIALC